MTPRVGILSVGSYLPDEVRRNDWWPDSVVDSWRRRAPGSRGRLDLSQVAEKELLSGDAKVLAALHEQRDDPFRGAIERRVAPQSMRASEMEAAAGREAILRAGLKPEQIDLIFVYSGCPDYHNVSNAAAVHRMLGLPEKCFTSQIDVACNAFQLQLTLAEQMIKTGQARYGILIQSCSGSRLVPPHEQHSAWFGDGATAVIVGPVGDTEGILGRAHRTDGSLHRALVCGVPGKNWYDEGRTILYQEDLKSAVKMMLRVADNGRDIVDEALSDAHLSRQDVDFFACHQAASWFRRVVQEHAGLAGAKSVDTFGFVGSLSAANIPIVLDVGVREGLLRKGDVVAMYSGGAGITWSGSVMRWSA